jgi:excisionase family DNA binding protein
MLNLDQLPDILTVKMIAEHIGWHQNTVYIRCTSGDLKSFKTGNSRRIRKQAYVDWITKLESKEYFIKQNPD